MGDTTRALRALGCSISLIGTFIAKDVKLRVFKEWLKLNRILPIPELLAKVAAKLRGHIAYYGVSDNAKGIGRFAYEVRMMLFKWLDRRGRRGSLNWEKFKKLLTRFPLPPRITVNLLRTT